MVLGFTWAVDDVIPPVECVHRNGVFCAGVVNLMLRSIGLPIPKNPPYDGGTQVYELQYQLVPFDLHTIRRGDAVYRPYTSGTDQGHIGIALGGPDDPLLQSFAESMDTDRPGVNVDYTVRESHCGSFYSYILPREELWKSI